MSRTGLESGRRCHRCGEVVQPRPRTMGRARWISTARARRDATTPSSPMLGVRHPDLRGSVPRSMGGLDWRRAVRACTVLAMILWGTSVVWTGVLQARAVGESGASPVAAAPVADVPTLAEVDAAAREARIASGRPTITSPWRTRVAVVSEVLGREAERPAAGAAAALDGLAGFRAALAWLVAALVLVLVVAGRLPGRGRPCRALTRALASRRPRERPLIVPTCGACAAEEFAWPMAGGWMPGAVRTRPLDPAGLDAPVPDALSAPSEASRSAGRETGRVSAAD